MDKLPAWLVKKWTGIVVNSEDGVFLNMISFLSTYMTRLKLLTIPYK